MALIVEDGTGLATAESYISVADASARLASLGDTTFDALASDALRETALRKATNYMEQRYSTRWKGERITADQVLSWPRYDANVHGYILDSDKVPVAVANACADLALISLTETLNPVLDRAVVREKVGPLETEYSEHSPQSRRYPAIDQMLAAYMKGGGVNALLAVR